MDEETMPVEEQTTPVEESTEQAPPPRHPFYDRIKAMHPDKEFGSDDELLSAADEKMTEHEGYRAQNEEANKMIIEALYAEPVLAQVLEEVGKGANLVQALAKYISPQDLEEAAGESDAETYEANKLTRESNRKAHQEFMDEVNANTAESQKTIEGWSAKRGLDPEAVTEFINEVSAILADAYKGKITEKFLDNMYEAKTKPDDLATAAEQGEIKGRNANIEELTAKETGTQGDGLPALSSMGSSTPEPKPTPKKHELQEIADFSKKYS